MAAQTDNGPAALVVFDEDDDSAAPVESTEDRVERLKAGEMCRLPVAQFTLRPPRSKC